MLDWYARDKSGLNDIVILDFEKIKKQFAKGDAKFNQIVIEADKVFQFKKKYTKVIT